MDDDLGCDVAGCPWRADDEDPGDSCVRGDVLDAWCTQASADGRPMSDDEAARVVGECSLFAVMRELGISADG